MNAESIIALAGVIITVLGGALHLSGRITKIETKMDLLLSGLIYVKRGRQKDDEND